MKKSLEKHNLVKLTLQEIESPNNPISIKDIELKLSKRFPEKSAWVAQSVMHLTPGFGSGHDLRVLRLSPVSGSVLSLLKILSLSSFSAPLPTRTCMLVLSLSLK